MQAIHQRRRWAVARVGAMARRGGPAPASAPVRRPPAHRPRRQRPALPSLCGQPGPLPQRGGLSPLRGPGGRGAQRRKPQPGLGPGPACPRLARASALSSGTAVPARRGDLSLGGFRGNLRQGNKEGLRHAQGRGINRALCRSDTAWGPVGEGPYVRIPGQGHTCRAATPWDPDRSPPARAGDPSSELVPSTTISANGVRNGPPPTRSLA